MQKLKIEFDETDNKLVCQRLMYVLKYDCGPEGPEQEQELRSWVLILILKYRSGPES